MRNYTSPKGYKGLSGFHKYWGKKPIEAWRYLIEHFTDENDVVLDPFLGSGLIARECIDQKRRFVGFDINPISIELTRMFVELPNRSELLVAFNHLVKSVQEEIYSLYSLSDGRIVSHFLWDGGNISKAWIKKSHKRFEITLTEEVVQKFQSTNSYQPKQIREIQLFDNSRINAQSCLTLSDLFTARALCAIDLLKLEIGKFDERTRRSLMLILSASLGQMSKMVFAVSKRGKTKGDSTEGIEVGSWVIGYWRPDQHFEVNAWNCFENKARKLLKAIEGVSELNSGSVTNHIEEFNAKRSDAYIKVGDSEELLDEIPHESIKVILTDPPHGDRIPYLELSEMWNSVLGLNVNYENELIVSNAKKRRKNIGKYNDKLSTIFEKCARVLCSGGLMAVMFNARSRHHWASLRKLEASSSFNYLGCYPMEYSAGSVVQDNRKGGLKTDYVLLFRKGSAELGSMSFLNALPGWSFEQPMKI